MFKKLFICEQCNQSMSGQVHFMDDDMPQFKFYYCKKCNDQCDDEWKGIAISDLDYLLLIKDLEGIDHEEWKMEFDYEKSKLHSR